MKGRRKTSVPASSGISSPNITTDAPSWLSEYAKEVWRETIESLDAEGRPLNRLNIQTLTGFCDAAGLVRECSEVLARDGMTIDGGREGKKRHPAVTTRISALNSLRSYAIELGLTPGTAGRIKPSTSSADHEASEQIRMNDPEGYAAWVAKYGKPPTNEFDMLG
ncbi:MAG: phage terminase small subunit P27 family [Verrucomicrobiota bacterium]